MIATKRNLQRELLEPAAFVTAAIGRLSESGAAERGAIFTRREVVEFILDLVGYTSEKPLWTLRVLEPSFGLGDFLEVVVLRLVESWKRHGKNDSTLLDSAVVGIEVHRETFLETGGKLRMQLEALGLARTDAARLVKRWLHCDDFLMRHFDESVDVVVGNPPYLRPEAIPNALLAEYRRQFVTMYDRADLYVPFIEKALSLLDEGGNLGFICSDRWLKNKYGGPLREMVSRDFHLKYYVDMVDTPAFTSDVIAYPAITVISKEHGEATRIAHRPEISAAALTELVAKLTGGAKGVNGAVQEIRAVMSGAEPWVLESDSLEGLSLVRKLEARFPTIEETGCKVGIGVATGADDVFIGAMEDLDVEESRKVPLVATRDIAAGHVEWRGLGVINPFGEDGKPVRLEDFPKLKRYFETHGAALRKRHVAKREGGCWYRTIDKITPSLAATPKLLIPDIKGTAHVVYEEGRLYPHHNLYFIVSDEWHLKALQAVLMSGLARLFVRTYSTKMRGGCLRFQAQYLRRIRLPHWSEIPRKEREALIAAADAGNEKLCNRLVAEIFGLSHKEQTLIEQN